MNKADLKEVKFEKYCKKCKHWDSEDWVEPCDECLCEAMCIGTEVPIHYDGPKLELE